MVPHNLSSTDWTAEPISIQSKASEIDAKCCCSGVPSSGNNSLLLIIQLELHPALLTSSKRKLTDQLTVEFGYTSSTDSFYRKAEDCGGSTDGA